MRHAPTEDYEFGPSKGSIWQMLRDIALSALVVCAIALITGFLAATSAHAQASKGELRIGYQKSASLFQPVYLAPADVAKP